MKFIIILASVLCVAIANLQACVTYNPTTGTYRIDQYGSSRMKKPNYKPIVKPKPNPQPKLKVKYRNKYN